MWGAGQRHLSRILAGRRVQVIHLGDHDPSGLDMSRDIRTRLTAFISFHLGHAPGDNFEVHRVALNIGQVRRYALPPNPAKPNDSRYREYSRTYGEESWELDALDPDVVIALVEENILRFLDLPSWQLERVQQESEREVLNLTSKHWSAVAKYLSRHKNGNE